MTVVRVLGKQGEPPTEVAELMAETRRELVFADGKAFRWLGVTGAMITTGISMTGGALNQLGVLAWVVWWTAVIAGLLSAIALALATYPRCRGDRSSGSAHYFGQVHRAARAGRLLSTLAHREFDDGASALAQVYWISRIVVIKYRFVQAGIVFAAISAVGFAYLFAVEASVLPDSRRRSGAATKGSWLGETAGNRPS